MGIQGLTKLLADQVGLSGGRSAQTLVVRLILGPHLPLQRTTYTRACTCTHALVHLPAGHGCFAVLSQLLM